MGNPASGSPIQLSSFVRPAGVREYVVPRPISAAMQQTGVGEPRELGVDLAHGGGLPVEAQRVVRPLLELVAGQLVAEGQQPHQGVRGDRKVLR